MSNEATGALVPCVSALDAPALGLNDEAAGDEFRPQRLLRVVPGAGAAVAWVADDLDAQARVLRLDGLSALTAVSPVGVHLLQARHLGASLCDQRAGSVAVLHAGSGDGDGQQQAQGVDDDMASAALDLLACIEARHAALRVLCASMMAALGSGLRPTRSRHCWRSRSCMASKMPAAAQRLKAL